MTTQLSFAQQLRNKMFNTNEEALAALEKALKVWHSDASIESEMHTYLGLTFPEFCSVTGHKTTILNLVENKQILATITQDQLQDFYTAWLAKPDHQRFGQFVYNQSYVEIDNSYNERDPLVAYNLLLTVCVSD